MTHPAYIIDLESNQNDNNDNEAHNNLSTSITSSSVITTSSPLGTGGRECPICLELFTKIGHHRIVITKCGHAFGKKCLDRCLEIKNQCPTCRKTVRKRDLIELYDCDIVAVDNSNLEKLKYDLQIEKQNRVKVVSLP